MSIKQLLRLEVCPRPGIQDVIGNKIQEKIREELAIETGPVQVIRVFTLEGLSREEAGLLLERAVLHDPISEAASLKSLALSSKKEFTWALEVGFRPGVTDNEGRTASETARLALGINGKRKKEVQVYTSSQYLFSLSGEKNAAEAMIHRIARDLLCNELIQRFEIMSKDEITQKEGFAARTAGVSGLACADLEAIPLLGLTDAELLGLSSARVLALSLPEMQAIRDHFAARTEERQKLGLGEAPTDVELECLAQTWSEHCKHKIFNALIDYQDDVFGRRVLVDSIFNSYIRGATKDIRETLGERDFCLSVFSDNAGVVYFTDELSICVKVETHNSPSALDPYGGALTGIVGVNRDPLGTGMGADLLCNTDVFCFASPFYDQPLPPRILHPRRIFEGVREGVEHGGNKSGIPTINGSLVFDPGFLGKPLVFCGTVGSMPASLPVRRGSSLKIIPSHEKRARPGDHVILAGGRTGKDGIHGATFSSEELHEGSPATAVQIGDPITQRRLYDFIIRARDLGLYSSITDNGAGGLSSSVGEMADNALDPDAGAEALGGADIDLALVPLKYDGLCPWEILLSEAQERMTLAVPEENLPEFLALAKHMGVEATDLGRFTGDGYFTVRHSGKIVGRVGLDFLHDGCPRLHLRAVWPAVNPQTGKSVGKIQEQSLEQGALLHRLLGRLNICSKESIIRRYDHEVKGGSVIKPLVGVKSDGPGDAAILRPDLSRPEGLVVAHGICPRFSALDTYWMAALALDEAVRGAVAAGADPDHLAGVDNFCWCDPVESERTPDGPYKLAQLVRANLALNHFCKAYGIPLVSGKDSMKNDYIGGGLKISIPPTLLVTVIGRIPDVSLAVSTDFKAPGNYIYVLGPTYADLDGSELAAELGQEPAPGQKVPNLDALGARRRYRSVHQAILTGLPASLHDLSDGGLGVALAEMCIGGRLGASVDLALVPVAGVKDCGILEKLYSETPARLLAEVRPEKAKEFEALLAGQIWARIGQTEPEPELCIFNAKTNILREPVEALAVSFKKTLDW